MDYRQPSREVVYVRDPQYQPYQYTISGTQLVMSLALFVLFVLLIVLIALVARTNTLLQNQLSFQFGRLARLQP